MLAFDLRKGCDELKASKQHSSLSRLAIGFIDVTTLSWKQSHMEVDMADKNQEILVVVTI